MNALYDRLRSGSDGLESFEDLLSGTESTLNRIRNPRDYRPSVSRHPTLVGHIWRVTNATAPDKLPALAKSLAAAVGIAAPEAEGFYETMTMVLERPSQPIEDANVRWGFNFVVSVRAACQLITAAAHADEYAEYPVQLARSLSLDLRTSLDRSMDGPKPPSWIEAWNRSPGRTRASRPAVHAPAGAGSGRPKGYGGDLPERPRRVRDPHGARAHRRAPSLHFRDHRARPVKDEPPYRHDIPMPHPGRPIGRQDPLTPPRVLVPSPRGCRLPGVLSLRTESRPRPEPPGSGACPRPRPRRSPRGQSSTPHRGPA